MAPKRTVQSYLEKSVPSPWYSVPLGTDALDVLADAQKEARELGHHEVETCHLLLALAKATGIGFKALNLLEVTEDAVRTAIERMYDEDEPETKGDHVDVEIIESGLRISPRAKGVIDEAQEEAYTFGRRQATPTDLLLALTKGRTECTSDKVFDQLGLPVTFVHSQLVRRIEHIGTILKRQLPGALGRPE